MTSLTPHQDAARQIIAEAEARIAEIVNQPGERPMRHRLNHALSSAYLLARAAEFDAGHSLEDIEVASVIAFANLIAMMIAIDPDLDANSTDALALASDLLRDIGQQVQARLGPNGKNARRISRRVNIQEGSA